LYAFLLSKIIHQASGIHKSACAKRSFSCADKRVFNSS